MDAGKVPPVGDGNGGHSQKTNLVQVLRGLGLEPANYPSLKGQLGALKDINPENVSKILSDHGIKLDDVSAIVKFLSNQQGNRTTPAPTSPVALPVGKYLPPNIKSLYLVQPSCVDAFANSDSYPTIKNVADRVHGKKDSDSKSRACAIACWLHEVVNLDKLPSQTIAPIERDSGRTPKLEDYFPAVERALDRLEPKPDFDLTRFGDMKAELTPSNMAAMSYALIEEIAIQNGVLILRYGWGETKDNIALIDPHRTFMANSPFGRKVPVYYAVPVKGDMGTLTMSTNYVVLPEAYLNNNNASNRGMLNNYIAYDSGVIDRNMFNFSKNPELLFAYLGLHYAGRIEEVQGSTDTLIHDINSSRLNDDVTELLVQSDLTKFLEKHLNRRFNEGADFDYTILAKALTKQTSPIYKKLEAISQEEEPEKKEKYALAMIALYSKLYTVSKCESSLLQFADNTCSALVDFAPEQLVGEPRHLLTAREEFTRLFGQKLSPDLDFGDDKPIDKKAWSKWANENLKGLDKEGDKIRAKTFDFKVRRIAGEILEEHFRTDLDSIPNSEGWRDFQANWT